MPHIPPGTKRVYLYVPPALADRLTAFLESEALGRVPQGSWNAFFLQRAEEFFATQRMPLHEHEGYGPMDWIAGPRTAIAKVAHDLEHKRQVAEGVDEAFPELAPPRLAPTLREGEKVCAFCRFPPEQCLCKPE